MNLLLSGTNFPIDLNCVEFFVVGQIKWLLNRLAVLRNLHLHALKTVGHEVQWLHFGYGRSNVLLGDKMRVKGLELRLISHAVLELSE